MVSISASSPFPGANLTRARRAVTLAFAQQLPAGGDFQTTPQTYTAVATNGALGTIGGVAGKLRVSRSGRQIKVGGLSNQTTGVTLAFPARHATGSVAVRLLKVHGGPQTARVSVGHRPVRDSGARAAVPLTTR